MGTVLEWSQWYHLQEWILDRYAVLLITLLPYMWVCRVWLFRFDHHKISTRRSFTYLNFKDFFLWPLKDWKKPVVDLRQSRTYQLPSFNSSGFHSKSSSSTSPAPAEPTILATPPGLINNKERVGHIVKEDIMMLPFCEWWQYGDFGFSKGRHCIG